MTRRKGYKHLTYRDRIKIEALYAHHITKRAIAAEIGCSIATIYRELKRGLYTRYGRDLEIVQAYSADIAQKVHDDKASAKGPALKIGKDFLLVTCIENAILDGDSPAAALKRAKKSKKTDTDLCIKTIYNYIHRELFLRITCKDLPRKGIKRTYDKVRRYHIKNPLAASIEDRPEEVNERTTFGHWEMDTVIGKKGKGAVLLVLTERLTRREIILKIKNKTQESVCKALDKLERKYGRHFKRIFRTITIDNGGEFLDSQALEKSCRTKSPRTKVYYCHPYSAFERGSNENANAMIRRKIPKGTPIERYSDAEIADIEQWINDYPRKIHAYECSETLYQDHLRQLDL